MGSGHPRPSSQHKRDLFAPEEQISGNQRQMQKIVKEGKGERSREKVKGYLFQRDKGLP